MNLSFFIMAPGLVCLFWAAVHSLLASKTYSFRILVILLLALFFTVAGDVLMGNYIGSESIAHILVMFMAPAIIPLTCLYFAFLYKPHTYKPIHLFWIIFPAVFFTSSFILTSINGLEVTDAFWQRVHSTHSSGSAIFQNNIEHMLYNWGVVFFRIFMGVEIVFLFVYCIILVYKLSFRPGDIVRFLFKKRRIRPLAIQIVLAGLITLFVCAKLFLHGNELLNNTWLVATYSALHTVLYFFFGFIGLFGAKKFLAMKDIRTAFRFNYTLDKRSETAEEIILSMVDYLNGESLTHVISRVGTQGGARREGTSPAEEPSLATAILHAGPQPGENGSLVAQFKQLMLEEQLFLLPGLTLTEVAKRLHTNKTYVSKMVNQTYNLGFPEVLNILRIDFAEQYIRLNPDASQDQIAHASGFQSASVFNTTFKRITGYTPKVWSVRVKGR